VYISLRFWRHASAVPEVCSFLGTRNITDLLESLGRFPFALWPGMQTDATSLVSNITVALPEVAVELCKRLSVSLDQATMLKSLVVSHADYAYLSLHCGEGIDHRDLGEKLLSDWFDFDLCSLASNTLTICVPSHLTLRYVASVLFAKMEFKPEQVVAPVLNGITVDDVMYRVGEHISLWSTESKETLSGLLWEVDASELWVRHPNSSLSIVLLSQITSGQMVVVSKTQPTVASEMLELPIKYLLLSQERPSRGFQHLDVLVTARLSFGK
jgi:hypothetical protein